MTTFAQQKNAWLSKATQRDVALIDIDNDENGQVRIEGTEKSTVERYAEDMQDGATFAPVDLALVDGKHIVLDGFHRVAAARLAELKAIPANVVEGLTDEQIFTWRSTSNWQHGKQLSNADKSKICHDLIERHLDKFIENYKIDYEGFAKYFGFGVGTVRKAAKGKAEKLTRERDDQFFFRLMRGESAASIGKDMGCSKNTVSANGKAPDLVARYINAAIELSKVGQSIIDSDTPEHWEDELQPAAREILIYGIGCSKFDREGKFHRYIEALMESPTLEGIAMRQAQSFRLLFAQRQEYLRLWIIATKGECEEEWPAVKMNILQTANDIEAIELDARLFKRSSTEEVDYLELKREQIFKDNGHSLFTDEVSKTGWFPEPELWMTQGGTPMRYPYFEDLIEVANKHSDALIGVLEPLVAQWTQKLDRYTTDDVGSFDEVKHWTKGNPTHSVEMQAYLKPHPDMTNAKKITIEKKPARTLRKSEGGTVTVEVRGSKNFEPAKQ